MPYFWEESPLVLEVPLVLTQKYAYHRFGKNNLHTLLPYENPVTPDENAPVQNEIENVTSLLTASRSYCQQTFYETPTRFGAATIRYITVYGDMANLMFDAVVCRGDC